MQPHRILNREHDLQRSSSTNAILTRICLSLVLLICLGGAGWTEDKTPVWRVELRLRTCSGDAAGTDDAVQAKLGSGNKTWLNSSANDFRKGKTRTYDLTLDGIEHLDDITKLEISKGGSDGVCLDKIDLYVNESLAFQRTGRKWLDNNDGEDHRTLTISGTELREGTMWPDVVALAFPDTFSPADVRSLVETAVAQAIHGEDVYWGHLHGNAVSPARKSAHVLTIDIDLAYRVDDWWDPGIDIDFDLILCKDGALAMTVDNVDVTVDSHWYSEVLSLGIAQVIDSKVANALKNRLDDLSVSDPGPAAKIFCPAATTSGGIDF